VFVGQDTNEWFDSNQNPNRIKLKYPFRFMLDQSTGVAKVAAPLFREEWIVIDMAGAIECD